MTREEALEQLRKPTNEYGTHRRALSMALLATEHLSDAVIELGMGVGSTRDLHNYCAAVNKPFVSVDTDEEWFERYADLASESHELLLRTSCLEAPFESRNWSVALVDHSPAHERAISISKLKGRCGIIVVHDLGSCAPPIAELKKQFLYAIEDPWEPQSAALSDTIDVTRWHFGPTGQEWYDFH